MKGGIIYYGAVAALLALMVVIMATEKDDSEVYCVDVHMQELRVVDCP